MRLRSKLWMATVSVATPVAFVLTAGLGGCSAAHTCDGVGEMCRLAGTGEKSYGADNLPALKTPLYGVESVRKGPDGRIYVVDINNYKLRAIDPDGTLRTVAGIGEHAPALDGVAATDSPLYDPIDFAFRADGRNVVVQWHDPRLLEIGLDGKMHLVAGVRNGCPNVAGTTNVVGVDGPLLEASFCELDAIAIDGQGRIFLADDTAHQIRMVADGMVTTLAGDGTAGYSGDGGAATQAHLFAPGALAIDRDGNLLVADTGNDVIRKIDLATGLITRVVGSQHRGYAGDGGPCLDADLNEPAGVVVDSDGSIYVADSFNQRIRRVDPVTELIETIAGTGRSGSTGDNGPAAAAELNHPQRLSIADGTLYIADTLSSVARAIRLR